MTRNSTDELGTADCNLRKQVPAGSYLSCVLQYTAGLAGIDDTGSLKIVMRYATDCGTPQFDDPRLPNYTTAAASNGAKLLLRYDVKDNVRPWGKTLLVKVLQGYLRRGDQITVTLGDRSGGSPGWRVQTFAEDSFELRMLVDRYATYVYEPLPKSPAFRIIAGEPTRLVAVAPSIVPPGKPILVRYKLEDAWGNPVGRPQRLTHSGFATAGCYRIPVSDAATGLQAESNPILVGRDDQFGRYWADLHGQSEETIGTNTVEQYFRFARDWGFLDACAHQGNDFQITDSFWRKIQETTRSFYRPGKFVTFPGWEWSGNTGLGGDRNVLFQNEGGPIFRSSLALVDRDEAAEPVAETVENLFQQVRRAGHATMLVPHVGGRYADLERHDPELERVVEVHSAWGTFEWMLADAFEHGYRVGIVANSDGHKGRPGASYPGASTFGSYGGLTCILAGKLDRDSVWQAYQSRRVYATTGARILLDVRTAEDQRMGDVIELGDQPPPEFHVEVNGTAAIERVEFRNGMRVLKTVRPYTRDDLGNRVKIVWQGAEVRGRGRQVVWDGGVKVTANRVRGFQPMNFYNFEQSCVQNGPGVIVWQSTTTGGTAGLILELDSSDGGQLSVETVQKSFRSLIGGLGLRGRTYSLGGVGKQIGVYRLPAAGGTRDLEFRFRPRDNDLHAGDNPLYVCVVQEDGQMAWSSPIYVVV